uniref:Methyltransferase GidB n=1 Tax=mine drainage metagenome TaxID=410659 RepID=E6QL23_9ZZZZ
MTLNDLLAEADSPPLSSELLARFDNYLQLLLRWNARTNLTAIRDPETILRRHFVESILCARALPAGISTLLDFGSGAGFPGLPIALCRPEISVTLAESQHKKAAFLREAVRTLYLRTPDMPVHVHAERAEALEQKFSCVTLRAVDKMHQATPSAIRLLENSAWLAILTTAPEADSIKTVAESRGIDKSIFHLSWQPPIQIESGSMRCLLLGQYVFA